VIAAASPPVKLGISARRVSVMLTMIEPENTGPNTAKAPSSHGLGCQALGHAGLGLRVGHAVLDLLAEDAAGGVDLLDGQLDAVLEVWCRRWRRRRRARIQAGDLDRVLGVDGRAAGGKGQRQGGAAGEGRLHGRSPDRNAKAAGGTSTRSHSS
jgi:hypothetical protein